MLACMAVQEELEQWAIASRQKEEDNIALEKYKRQDDSRIRDLTVAIEKARLAPRTALRRCAARCGLPRLPRISWRIQRAGC